MGVMFGAAGHSQDVPIPQIYEECSAGSRRGYVSRRVNHWGFGAPDCFHHPFGPQTREVCLYHVWILPPVTAIEWVRGGISLDAS